MVSFSLLILSLLICLSATTTATAPPLPGDNETDRAILTSAALGNMFGPDADQWKGLDYMTRALAETATPVPYTMDDPIGRNMAMYAGRFLIEAMEFSAAAPFVDRAATSSLPNDCPRVMQASVSSTLIRDPMRTSATPLLSLHSHPPRTQMQLAVAAHAPITSEAEAILRRERELYKVLLSGPVDLLSTPTGDVLEDDFVFCFITSFYLETLFETDFAETASRRAELVAKSFPYLNFVSPILKPLPPVRVPKIRIGIASAFLMMPGGSVGQDFTGVLGLLSPDRFEVHLFHLMEQWGGQSFMGHWPALASEQSFPLDTKTKAQGPDTHTPMWLAYARMKIGSLDLDMLFFPELTMSTMGMRLAMSRLAPTQVTSHGHPVTSGMSTIDYYVSWAAAELETAQEHYTEELVLLPGDSMHQVRARRCFLVP